MNARRSPHAMMALSLVGGVLVGSGLTACGDGPEGDAAGAAAEGPAASNETVDALETEVAPRFSLDGRGESGKTSAVLEVREGEVATLSITGADASDNIIVISVTFEDVEGVVGTHTLPIGVVDERVFAVGSVDGQAYQSVSGELELSLSADRHAEGHFRVGLGRNTLTIDTPGAPPSGEATAPIEELTLSGAFESQWTVNCYSRLRGFTGGHLISDSPFCNGLTFE